MDNLTVLLHTWRYLGRGWMGGRLYKCSVCGMQAETKTEQQRKHMKERTDCFLQSVT